VNGHLVTDQGLTVFYTSNGYPWGWEKMELFPETWRTPYETFGALVTVFQEST
jgi:hypothetical protein